jgi:segregation and condensation protein B
MDPDQLSHAFAQLLGHTDDASSGAPQASDASTPDDAGLVAEPLDTPDSQLDQQGISPATVLEAALFVGHPQNEPLTSRRLASLVRGVSPQEVDAWIEQLNQQYEQQQAPYHIASVGAGYRMELRSEFNRLSASFYGRVREARLSQAAVDLLAIVAYRQPISRDEIDRLRGQSSGATLAQLVRRQLLQVTVQPEKPRHKLYRTTDRFLDLFGLESLEDLPSPEE